MIMRKECRFFQRHRVLAILLSVVLALSILLGTAFVLAEAHHHCTGEHCEICAAIARDVAFLHADSAPALLHGSAPVFLKTFLLAAEMPRLVRLQHSSPVTLKVKLSD